MPALDETLEKRLSALEASHLRRAPREVEREAAPALVRVGKRLISFSCNDYLGLSHHPEVIAASVAATQRYGTGAGASRLVTGEHPLYALLEAKLAAWHGTQAACVFGSGYLANLGVMSALVGEGDVIMADKLSHASMLDGAKLSGAAVKRFAHNDLAHLETILQKQRSNYKCCLIITESVFSMDGDIAPLDALTALAERYDAWLLVDKAHDLRRHSREGGNLEMAARDSYFRRNDEITVGTLSKTLGAYGGYVCGSKILVDYLKTSARSMIYTTALPPGVVAAASAALDVIAREPELLGKPIENARYFTSLMGLPEAQSAIVPLIIGDAEAAISLSAQLEEAGFSVTAIRPPTVLAGTARLRCAHGAHHTREDIERLVDCLKSHYHPLPLPEREGSARCAHASKEQENLSLREKSKYAVFRVRAAS